jgi:hypothetical protein
MENSGDLEGGDSVVSLLRQLPANQHEQEGSIGDMPSSNKASDVTSDSSEEKQAPPTMTEVNALKYFWFTSFKLRQFIVWTVFKK